MTDSLEKEENTLPQPYVVDGMKYKMDGNGLRPQNQFTQIAVVYLADGHIKQFTSGYYDHHLVAISRDGKQLVMGVNRAENTDFEFRTPLYVVDIETKQETVLADEAGYYGGATFSFDNRYVAYVGSDATYKNATHTQLYVYDLETKLTQNITEMLDAPVGDLAVADVHQGIDAPAVVWTETNAL